MIYLTFQGGTRVPLDEKVKVRVEGVDGEFDLMEAMLAFYDSQWAMGYGIVHYGEDEEPAVILRLTDPFSGMTMDTPFLNAQAEKAGRAMQATKSLEEIKDLERNNENGRVN